MSMIARLTLDEYDRMIERAVFERDRRIELIHGDPSECFVEAKTSDWRSVGDALRGVPS